jgi:hypothetical protein
MATINRITAAGMPGMRDETATEATFDGVFSASVATPRASRCLIDTRPSSALNSLLECAMLSFQQSNETGHGKGFDC